METARVRLHSPQYERDGQMYVNPDWLDWTEVPYLDPTDCDHQVTICLGCVDSWALDQDVEIPEPLYLPES